MGGTCAVVLGGRQSAVPFPLLLEVGRECLRREPAPGVDEGRWPEIVGPDQVGDTVCGGNVLRQLLSLQEHGEGY